MRIPIRWEIDVTWYLSVGISSFYHSSQGRQLERAHAFRYTSGGSPIAVPDKNGVGYWFMHVPAEDRNPSVEFDPVLLDRFGRVSRRLLQLERVDPTAARLVELWYGDEGARWAHQANPGRLMCLYPHTKAGMRYLQMSGPVEGLRDAERLANCELMYKTQGSHTRLVKQMRTEAGELLIRMWRAWRESEPVAA